MTGIYIHIPFCVSKCSYCDFVSFPADISAKTSYVDSLVREIQIAATNYKNRIIDTVFIGGGTPSCLPASEISRIMFTVNSLFNVKDNAEITIECNPGTVTLESLITYKNCGINRLSFGLQSTDDNVLKGISRIHTYEDFLVGLSLAKDAGFDNINADIMYGLPNQTLDIFADTLLNVCSLGLNHISAYALILEEHTQLYNAVKTGKTKLPNEDTEYAMHRLAIDTLQKNGYLRYEISNYAKVGYECKHNLRYWDCSEYIGFGINSHSAMYIGGKWTRYSNLCNLVQYVKTVLNGALPIEQSEIISKEDAMKEYLMVGLRKTLGISEDDFTRRFDVKITDVFGGKINELNDYLTLADGRLFMTDKGLDMQNYVLCELL